MDDPEEEAWEGISGNMYAPTASSHEDADSTSMHPRKRPRLSGSPPKRHGKEKDSMRSRKPHSKISLRRHSYPAKSQSSISPRTQTPGHTSSHTPHTPPKSSSVSETPASIRPRGRPRNTPISFVHIWAYVMVTTDPVPSLTTHGRKKGGIVAGTPAKLGPFEMTSDWTLDQIIAQIAKLCQVSADRLVVGSFTWRFESAALTRALPVHDNQGLQSMYDVLRKKSSKTHDIVHSIVFKMEKPLDPRQLNATPNLVCVFICHI